MSSRRQSPRLDPSSYKWEQSSATPSVWQRRALSGECMWIPRRKEYHEIFVCGALTLEKPITAFRLRLAVKSAGRRLRFEVPELVARAGYGLDGEGYVRYVTAKDNDEVEL